MVIYVIFNLGFITIYSNDWNKLHNNLNNIYLNFKFIYKLKLFARQCTVKRDVLYRKKNLYQSQYLIR